MGKIAPEPEGVKAWIYEAKEALKEWCAKKPEAMRYVDATDYMVTRLHSLFGLVAQPEERPLYKGQVPGSSPGGPTNSGETEDRISRAQNYAIALQQSIEHYCRGAIIPPEIAKKAPHHSGMLNAKLGGAEGADTRKDSGTVPAGGGLAITPLPADYPRMDAEKIANIVRERMGSRAIDSFYTPIHVAVELACAEGNRIIDALAKRAEEAEAGRDRMLEEARARLSPAPSPKPEPAKPRRMKGNPTVGPKGYHGSEHAENIDCGNEHPCVPVEEKPLTPSGSGIVIGGPNAGLYQGGKRVEPPAPVEEGKIPFEWRRQDDETRDAVLRNLSEFQPVLSHWMDRTDYRLSRLEKKEAGK